MTGARSVGDAHVETATGGGVNPNSTSTRLMAELRDAPPYRREEKLAEVERIYGSGFARALREQLAAERRGESAP